MGKMKPNGRRNGCASFVRFEHRLLDHPAFHALSPIAVKAKGLRSNDTLRRGTLELIAAGFVVQSRQGGRNRCSLFALAWFPIDPCDGKLDIPATRTAPINWLRLGNLSEPNTVQCEPNTVQSASKSAASGHH
jgi:hypothetical protein